MTTVFFGYNITFCSTLLYTGSFGVSVSLILFSLPSEILLSNFAFLVNFWHFLLRFVPMGAFLFFPPIPYPALCADSRERNVDVAFNGKCKREGGRLKRILLDERPF